MNFSGGLTTFIQGGWTTFIPSGVVVVINSEHKTTGFPLLFFSTPTIRYRRGLYSDAKQILFPRILPRVMPTLVKTTCIPYGNYIMAQRNEIESPLQYIMHERDDSSWNCNPTMARYRTNILCVEQVWCSKVPWQSSILLICSLSNCGHLTLHFSNSIWTREMQGSLCTIAW